MIFKTKPPSPHREIALSVLTGMAFLGLFFLAFTDNDSRQAFESMATFIIGATVGYFIPGQK